MGRRADRVLAQRGGFVELLRIPAACFGTLAWLRAKLYGARIFPVLKVDRPVISIGNLSVGGTGKTPFVEWMVRHFEAQGVRVGVLARGYGRQPGELLNDEGRMLAESFPGVLQEQNPDRVSGALRLLDRQADAIVLDDGFQHRRLHRDLDIVLMDATRPFGLAAPDGGGEPVRAFLPRGFLREGPRALKRAHCVVLTRCDGVDRERLHGLKAQIAQWAPQAIVVQAVHRAVAVLDPDGVRQNLDMLQGKAMELVSGIGNPGAFERSAREAGIQVEHHRVFADHHSYGEGDLQGLGDSVLTTAKDWPKLKGLVAPGSTWILLVEMELVHGGQEFVAMLDALAIREGAEQRAQDRDTMHAGLHG